MADHSEVQPGVKPGARQGAEPNAATPEGAPAKTVYIKTFGCQMNVYDSTRMADALAPAGYQAADSPEGADLVLLNTCHIREKAAEKVYSELGRLRHLRDAKRAAGGDMLIGVAGCVAQAEGEEIARRQPMVDLIVGPQAYHRLPEMTRAAATRNSRAAVIDTDFPVEDKFASLPRPRRSGGPTAFVTVQEGCDKFCAFCVVPYTRGAEYSRPAAKIIDETRALVDQGVREVTLLGQNVNAYHGEGPAQGETGGAPWSLARLIRALAEIDGLARIRYTTSHPNDMTDDLIAAHGEIDALAPYLHLPIQSGSDKVLKAMNRKHAAAAYVDLVARIRAARPDIAMSGDFIVGFPGETEADFQDTLDLVKEVGYASAFSFKYSPRPGTPAANAPQLDEDVKTERLHRLQELLNAQQTAFQQSCVRRVLPVLLEKAGRHEGQLVGRSPYLQPTHLDPQGAQIGDIVDARIVAATKNSLSGEIVL